MPQINRGQLVELVERTRAVLNAANEAADQGRISDTDADFVEQQLQPIFNAAQQELQRSEPAPEPPPEPARAPRRRY